MLDTPHDTEAAERRSTMPPPRGDWTDERVDMLKAMWADGRSASEIAAALGAGATRNAVIGKVHRLKLASHGRNDVKSGLARRHDGYKPPRNKAGQPKRTDGAHRNKGQTSGPDIARRIAARMAGPNIVGMPLPEEREEGVDCTSRIGLLQLNERTCKWPIGDPLSADFGFCGKPKEPGHPYCDRHRARATGGHAS